MRRSGNRPRPGAILALVGLLAALVVVPTSGVASALTGPAGITRVSTAGDGSAANGASPRFNPPAVSVDGRFIAFESDADNVYPTAADGGVFVRDTTAGSTTVAAVLANGTVDDRAASPAFSWDARYVAYTSDSKGVVSGPGNDQYDQVYVRDRTTGVTTRVSSKTNGNQASDESAKPSLSADGRYVVFESDSPGLVPNDTNDWTDVFVRDRVAGTTKRVSVRSTGAEADIGGQNPSISADGRYVAFTSFDQLVPADTNIFRDVYVRDLTANTTRLVSVSSGGALANGHSTDPRISSDGRFVAFASAGTNLDGISDTNAAPDIFVRDLVANTTQRVSRSSGGALAHGAAALPSISGDGRFVSYESSAADAVTDDTNGVVDAFVYDRTTAKTTRISTDQLGQQLATGGTHAVLSVTGTSVTFSSASPITGWSAASYPQLYKRLTVPAASGGALPEISIGNASVVEGNVGTRQLRFTVSLSRPADSPITMSYATTAGTASAGVDFTAKSGVLTIPASTTSVQVAIPVAGDVTAESEEKFTVNLASPQGGVLRRASGTGTITNDDPPPSTAIRISIGNASLVEGDTGNRGLKFALTMSAPQTKDVTVRYATILGTAGANDVTAKSGTVTIPARSNSATISIAVKPDTTAEPTEAFKVKLSNAVGASIQVGTASGSILDDD